MGLHPPARTPLYSVKDHKPAQRIDQQKHKFINIQKIQNDKHEGIERKNLNQGAIPQQPLLDYFLGLSFFVNDIDNSQIHKNYWN